MATTAASAAPAAGRLLARALGTSPGPLAAEALSATEPLSLTTGSTCGVLSLGGWTNVAWLDDLRGQTCRPWRSRWIVTATGETPTTLSLISASGARSRWHRGVRVVAPLCSWRRVFLPSAHHPFDLWGDRSRAVGGRDSLRIPLGRRRLPPRRRVGRLCPSHGLAAQVSSHGGERIGAAGAGEGTSSSLPDILPCCAARKARIGPANAVCAALLEAGPRQFGD